MPGPGPASFAGQPSDDASNSWPPFGWVFAAVVAVVALVGATWWWLATRGDETATNDAASERFVRAFDDGLAALESESDPRRAVILAYVAMERALAAHGLARKSSEAPVEYMLRVLLDVPTCRDPVHRLTDLFEEARFSRHTISGAGRTAALDALLTRAQRVAANAVSVNDSSAAERPSLAPALVQRARGPFVVWVFVTILALVAANAVPEHVLQVAVRTSDRDRRPRALDAGPHGWRGVPDLG